MMNSIRFQLRNMAARSEEFARWLVAGQRRATMRRIERVTDQPTPIGDPSDQTGKVVAREDWVSRRIHELGLTSGIASRLKEAADGYVDAKLDEIERRIDAKFEQIDRRLAEWRDQEIAHRLRMVKITLAASVLVAIVSLAYTIIRYHVS